MYHLVASFTYTSIDASSSGIIYVDLPPHDFSLMHLVIDLNTCNMDDIIINPI